MLAYSKQCNKQTYYERQRPFLSYTQPRRNLGSPQEWFGIVCPSFCVTCLALHLARQGDGAVLLLTLSDWSWDGRSGPLTHSMRSFSSVLGSASGSQAERRALGAEFRGENVVLWRFWRSFTTSESFSDRPNNPFPWFWVLYVNTHQMPLKHNEKAWVRKQQESGWETDPAFACLWPEYNSLVRSVSFDTSIWFKQKDLTLSNVPKWRFTTAGEYLKPNKFIRIIFDLFSLFVFPF